MLKARYQTGNKSELVLILDLIDWESGVSFLDQS